MTRINQGCVIFARRFEKQQPLIIYWVKAQIFKSSVYAGNLIVTPEGGNRHRLVQVYIIFQEHYQGDRQCGNNICHRLPAGERPYISLNLYNKKSKFKATRNVCGF